MIAVIVIGVGLALAPAIFQMFTRAPAGGGMIDDFAPHMTEERLTGFADDLAAIRSARDEAAAIGITDPALHPSAAPFVNEYPAIDEDMSSMLEVMRGTVDEYDGVAALPPFALFPWFFVIPGVLLAGAGAWALRRGPGDRGAALVAVAVLGLGLIAAPAVFQMFTRAPGGERMIDDFRPYMTREKVTTIQGYFVVIGNGEAELRNEVTPELTAAGRQDEAAAIEALSDRWPGLSAGMAPMIGAMADNLDAFAGIAALPPFGLFPWFFVAPGVLAIALAALARGPLAARTGADARSSTIDEIRLSEGS